MGLYKRDHGSLSLWAADCAEHVLPCFEEERPKDDRPRNAVEAGRAWARGEIAMGEARAAAFAAHAAPPASRTPPITLPRPPPKPRSPPTLPPPPPRNVIGSTDAFRSTFGRWRFPPEAAIEAVWTVPIHRPHLEHRRRHLLDWGDTP